MKKFYASLAALTVAISAILLLNVVNGTSNAADCDDNAIMKCGASSSSELAKQYNKNPHHDLDNIYRAYGLSDSELRHASSYAKTGYVHKDGRVTVGSSTVATNATTIGRQYMPGSHKKHIGGGTYWERTPSVSFRSSSLRAFVFFDKNGEFKAAIIMSCGNPVSAHPKPKPKPKPSYACTNLTKDQITRTEYSFTASASAKNGAKVTGYAFDFGDGQEKSSSSRTIKHTYDKPGTYTVKVTAKVKVGSSNKTAGGPKCQLKLTVTPPPETPEYTCDGLAFTDISRTEFRFKAAASASGGAEITGYNFDFGDGTKQTSPDDTVTHEYAEAGEYTVKVMANVRVGDDTKTASGDECEVKVPVGEAPAFACDSLEATKISRTEYSFDGKATAENGAEIIGYTFDFGDGKQQTVTDATNVKHTYEKDGDYTVTMSVTAKVDGEAKTASGPDCTAHAPVVPPEECKPGIPVGDKRCEEAPKYCKPGIPVGDERCTPCEVPGKEDLPKDSPECVETPVKQLPTTGPGSLIGGTLGLGSMVTAAGYYAASRRNLLAELLKR